MEAQRTLRPEPLSDAQLAAIRWARDMSRPVRRAARVARINGAIMGVGAVLALVGGIGPALLGGGVGLPAALLGIVLAIAAWNERRGARALVSLEPAAPARLAVNQALIGLGIGGYAAWHLIVGLTSRGEVQARLREQGVSAGDLKRAGIDPELISELASLVTVGLYGGVILGVILVQSLMALYYLRKRRAIERCRDGAPGWAAEVVAELA